jgi:DNA-directed RNA polymerase subunit RPC12/RpoP
MQVNIKNLIDDVQCDQTIRDLRWPDGVDCPSCGSKVISEKDRTMLE